jgi:broad specificity phosphatase PhoE
MGKLAALRGDDNSDMRERMSIEIVFETHSTSTDNERGLATGWLEGRLSEAGRRQASELGERRRADNIASVFTSDSGRAVETAEIAFGGSGIPIHRDRRLRECNYGELNGRSVPEVDAVRASHVVEPFPDGESYRDVVDRVRRFLDDLSPEFEGARVVVIGHAATRWALDHALSGASLEELVKAPFAWQEGWTYVLRTS